MSTGRIQALLRVLNAAARLKGKEKYDFSHALGISSSQMQPGQLAYFQDAAGNGITFRCTLPGRLLIGKDKKSINLSTYLAILDDVTTWALMADKPKHLRPGVSVAFKMAWGDGMDVNVPHKPDVPLDITASIIKAGRNLSFLRAEVKELDTGKLICYGSHTKFLPVGKLEALALSPFGVWLLRRYADWKDGGPGKEYEAIQPPPLTETFDSLRFQSDSSATFTVSPHHANAGLGPLHGGCQSILMELVGERAAKSELGSKNVHLESIDMLFMNSPRKKITIEAMVISRAGLEQVTLRLQLKRQNGGSVISEGLLIFSAKDGNLSKM